MKIHYIEHKDINKEKWDYCIETACNGRIYAMSWYLDTADECWDALIVGDYEIVFPLTYRKIFGFRFLCQPIFCQQLGIFAQTDLSHEIIMAFLKSIPKKFLFGKLHLNSGNKIQSIKQFPIEHRVNIELDIRPSIKEVREKYIRNNKRNINKAKKSSVYIRKGVDFERIIQTYKLNLGDSRFNVHSSLYKTVNKVFTILKENGNLAIYDAYIDDIFVAGIVLSSFQNKTISLFLGCNKEGYQISAGHFLFDYAIENASQTKEIFDFEGSNTESVAFVFHGFGGKTVPYPIVTISNVPKFIVKVFTLLRNLKRKLSNKKA